MVLESDQYRLYEIAKIAIIDNYVDNHEDDKVCSVSLSLCLGLVPKILVERARKSSTHPQNYSV